MKTVFRLTQPPIPLSACFINSSTHRGRAMSQRYETWIQESRIDYLRQRPKPIAGPVTILYEFERKDKRKRDLSNLIKAPEDFLVKCGVIEDDSLVWDFRAKWSDEVEGCRITIESIFSSVASSKSSPNDGQDNDNQNPRATS